MKNNSRRSFIGNGLDYLLKKAAHFSSPSRTLDSAGEIINTVSDGAGETYVPSGSSMSRRAFLGTLLVGGLALTGLSCKGGHHHPVPVGISGPVDQGPAQMVDLESLMRERFKVQANGNVKVNVEYAPQGYNGTELGFANYTANPILPSDTTQLLTPGNPNFSGQPGVYVDPLTGNPVNEYADALAEFILKGHFVTLDQNANGGDGGWKYVAPADAVFQGMTAQQSKKAAVLAELEKWTNNIESSLDPDFRAIAMQFVRGTYTGTDVRSYMRGNKDTVTGKGNVTSEADFKKLSRLAYRLQGLNSPTGKADYNLVFNDADIAEWVTEYKLGDPNPGKLNRSARVIAGYNITNNKTPAHRALGQVK